MNKNNSLLEIGQKSCVLYIDMQQFFTKLMKIVSSCLLQYKLACVINFDKLRRKMLKKLECGPMPNVMVALPNIGGALCSTPQSLADAH